MTWPTKSLKVSKCDRLKHLFSISVAKSLSQLQEVEVTDCKNLEGILLWKVMKFESTKKMKLS